MLRSGSGEEVGDGVRSAAALDPEIRCRCFKEAILSCNCEFVKRENRKLNYDNSSLVPTRQSEDVCLAVLAWSTYVTKMM